MKRLFSAFITIAVPLFALFILLLVISLLAKPKPSERSYEQRGEEPHQIVIVSVKQVQDFYGNDEILVSYSFDGMPQAQELPEKESAVLYPRFLAYLREQGEVRILGEREGWME